MRRPQLCRKGPVAGRRVYVGHQGTGDIAFVTRCAESKRPPQRPKKFSPDAAVGSESLWASLTTGFPMCRAASLTAEASRRRPAGPELEWRVLPALWA